MQHRTSGYRSQTDRFDFRGPESVAFDGQGQGPYSGVSNGRVLKWLVRLHLQSGLQHRSMQVGHRSMRCRPQPSKSIALDSLFFQHRACVGKKKTGGNHAIHPAVQSWCAWAYLFKTSRVSPGGQPTICTSTGESTVVGHLHCPILSILRPIHDCVCTWASIWCNPVRPRRRCRCSPEPRRIFACICY
jgi:hypothetical protein